MLETINVQLHPIVFMLLNFISLSLFQLGINQLFMGRLDLGVSLRQRWGKKVTVKRLLLCERLLKIEFNKNIWE